MKLPFKIHNNVAAAIAGSTRTAASTGKVGRCSLGVLDVLVGTETAFFVEAQQCLERFDALGDCVWIFRRPVGCDDGWLLLVGY